MQKVIYMLIAASIFGSLSTYTMEKICGKNPFNALIPHIINHSNKNNTKKESTTLVINENEPALYDPNILAWQPTQQVRSYGDDDAPYNHPTNINTTNIVRTLLLLPIECAKTLFLFNHDYVSNNHDGRQLIEDPCDFESCCRNCLDTIENFLQEEATQRSKSGPSSIRMAKQDKQNKKKRN